jgi:hypothetical protein
LKAHSAIMRNDLLFKRWVGGGLVIVSSLGLWGLVIPYTAQLLITASHIFDGLLSAFDKKAAL